MADAASTRPNADQVDAWNGPTGERWLKQYDVVGRQLAPLGERVMDHLAIGPGEQVLDIGCGTGETTAALARRVGAGGSVLGIDISRPLLDVANARARSEGIANVRFAEADAQTFRFEPASFDALYSRFGVMFFEDPAAAFANLRGALRAEGRLAFVCWRSRDENPFMTLPTRVGSAFLDNPPAFDPAAPGPFAFADAGRLRGLLTAASFTDVAIAPFDDTFMGDPASVRQTMEWRDPLNRLLAESDAGRRAEIDAALDAALAPFIRDGRVTLPAATWLVSARAG